MASSLRVNAIIPSSGTNVAIGTAGGTITYNANVSGVSTFSSGIVVSVGNTEALRTDSNSNIGIKTTSTSGFNGACDDVVISGSADVGLTFHSTSTTGTGSIAFTDTVGSSTQGAINYFHNGDYMIFQTGASERMRIDSSGRTTTPSQVSFAARVATQQTNVTGNAVYFTLIADSTSATGSHNVGSHYSTSTGVFTAPVTGRYYFNAHVLYDNSVLTRFGELWLSYNNDSTRWFLDRRYWASGGNITAIGGSVVINVTAGDNIRVRGFVAGGVQDVDVQGSGEPVAHFSGYLLG